MKIILLSALLGLGASLTLNDYGIYDLNSHAILAVLASLPAAYVIFATTEQTNG